MKYFLVNTESGEVLGSSLNEYIGYSLPLQNVSRSNDYEGLTYYQNYNNLKYSNGEVVDKSEEELKQREIARVRDEIDDKTDEMIYWGFFYQGVHFKADLEHQMSYKAEHDIREELTYPHTIKGIGENYLQIQSADHYHEFYLTGLIHVRTVIEVGWYYKQQVESLTYQQLVDWVDNRTVSSSSSSSSSSSNSLISSSSSNNSSSSNSSSSSCSSSSFQ